MHRARTQELYAFRRFERNVIGVLALMFIVSGLIKFFGPALLTSSFVDWGYPGWFAYLIGIVEIAGGILLLGDRSSFYGACLLGCVMFGAFFTHLVHAESQQAIVPLAMMAMLFLVAQLHSARVVGQVERLLRWYELDGQDELFQP